MNQPKTKPMAAAAAVAPTRKPPYTAARHGKDGAVTGAGAEGFGGALDRRVTEGFNLVHGRFDVIQEDVRENRRDIKEFRRELSAGLKDATAERARLAEKTYLDRLRAEMNERFVAAEESQRHFRAELNERFVAAEESQRHFRAELNDRFAASEESQRHFRVELNDRFAASEESQRQFRGGVERTLRRFRGVTTPAHRDGEQGPRSERGRLLDPPQNHGGDLGRGWGGNQSARDRGGDAAGAGAGGPGAVGGLAACGGTRVSAEVWRGARLTRRVREEYLVYFDRNATKNGAKRSGSGRDASPAERRLGFATGC